MASLKFLLQDPLQATSSNNHTTIISSKLICFYNRIDLFIQHLLEIIRRARDKTHGNVVKEPEKKDRTRLSAKQEEDRFVKVRRGIGIIPSRVRSTKAQIVPKIRPKIEDCRRRTIEVLRASLTGA